MSIDVQALVDRGYTRCPRCAGLVRPGVTVCKFCEHPTAPDTTATPGRATPTARSGRGRSKAKALNPEANRGGLGSLADLDPACLTLVVRGLPVQQGSLSAVAPGVIKREDGPELVAWRNKITTEALRVCGSTWVAPNTGVRVDLVFTVPPTKSTPTTKAVPADGYRDLDKLARAVGDALCPSVKPGQARFRVLASDMRITGNLIGPEKTHPRPLHTHPLALDVPGVVIRVTPATAPLEVVRRGDGWAMVIPCPDPATPPVSDGPLARLAGGAR